MKKYLTTLFIIVFIIPSIAFASWWNPFSWSWFKKPTPVVQQEPTKQVTDSNLKQETNNTQIKSTKNGLPDTISAKDAKALGWGVNKPPVIQSDDTAKQLACSVQLKGLMAKWNNVESIIYNKKLDDCLVGITVNGEITYSKIEDLQDAPTTQVITPSPQPPIYTNSLNAQQQAIIDSQNQAYQKYLDEQAEIQAKLKPLNDEVNQKEADYNKLCNAPDGSMRLNYGHLAAECNLIQIDEQTLLDKISIIMGIYPNIKSLPQSPISCSYGNGGTTWSCADSSHRTTISCFYANGGTTLNCN